MTMTIGDAVGSAPQGRSACALHGVRRQQRPARPTPASGSTLKSQRGLSYLLTAPGDLGMARAYVTGDLDVEGVHPGDPYDALVLLQKHLKFRAPAPRRGARDRPRASASPPQAAAPAAAGDAAPLAARGRGPAPLQGPRRGGDPPPLRRLQPLLRAGARPVDDLHLRRLPHRRRHARGGAGRQVRPGRPQARAQAGHAAARRRLRLGRHGPPRRRASTASRRSASRSRASRPSGRRQAIDARGARPTSPRCATATTATCSRPTSTRSARSGSPSTSACGNYPPYFGFLRDKLRPQGRLLNHCITRPHNQPRRRPARSSTATCSPTAS